MQVQCVFLDFSFYQEVFCTINVNPVEKRRDAGGYDAADYY